MHDHEVCARSGMPTGGLPAVAAAARAARRSRLRQSSAALPVGSAERGVGLSSLAGRGLALRIALVEQRARSCWRRTSAAASGFCGGLLRLAAASVRLLRLALALRRSGLRRFLGEFFVGASALGLRLTASAARRRWRSAAVGVISCFSADLRCRSPRSGFGSRRSSRPAAWASRRFGAVLTPLVSCEKSFVADDVDRQRFGRRRFAAASPANETTAHSSTAACRPAEIAEAVRICIVIHGALLDLRHQRDAVEAGRRQPPHHLHHGAVIDLLVAAHIDALVGAAARLGDRLKLGQPVPRSGSRRSAGRPCPWC